VLLPGGTDAVSADVQRAIEAMGISVLRFPGADRTDTAVRLADWAIANASFSNTHANLARGDDFADALAGGPHGGSDGPAPIVLTLDPSSLGSTTRAWFATHAPTLTGGHLFGGTAAVSQAAEDDAVTAARSSSPSPSTTVATPSPYFTGAKASAGQATISVTYDEAISCGSIDADGSDFRITISTGPGSPATYAPRAAACSSPTPVGTSDTVVLTLPDGTVFRSKQTGRVDPRTGTDGDSVEDPFGRAQVAGNYVPFTVS